MVGPPPRRPGGLMASRSQDRRLTSRGPMAGADRKDAKDTMGASEAMPSRLLIPRRSFLIGFGRSAGTLVLGLGRSARAAGAPSQQLPRGGLAANPLVHVAADGMVTVVSHRAEMGQGIRST